MCGEDVPARALACPECGADHSSGWRDEATYDGVDLPDEFDYDEFARKEFGSAAQQSGIRPIWWITALVLAVLTLLYLFATR
ncbi:MAG: zinc ribbon domain-containing protein [Verrucomicrobiota bacterium]|nr:zinc ribbon domain-containing protein [Verrucomicrobiota bacterium]